MNFLLNWWCSQTNDPVCQDNMWFGDTATTLFNVIRYYYCEDYDCESSAFSSNYPFV